VTPECASSLALTALPEFPIVRRGDDLAALIEEGLASADITLRDGDVLVVTSKIVSRAEGRRVRLEDVEVSPRASDLAATIDKDPRLVELILGESVAVSRATRGVLIVRHRLGFVSANAGIDASNVERGVLLLPIDPDRSAETIRSRFDARIGVIISDSLGRPFRLGTVGTAIGLAGLPGIVDHRGRRDLFGRPLEHTVTGFADEIAAAADLVAGQAAEGRAVIHVRGLRFSAARHAASELLRPVQEDLYA
jgi:coenzyme F420-0:L-glutamate ligase/coenzyme F420-1:gamma-L-glutamate ligase